MRILVTGAGGQVGRALVEQGGDSVLGVRRTELDITDRKAVQRAVQVHTPSLVVNAAAFTAVDRAESDAARAFAINRDGPAHLADACAEAGIPLLHLSTDYVFDGTKGDPYIESDTPNPLGVYGQSKWEGEEAVCDRLDRHVILRTSWVFGAHGGNFVRTMLRLMRERDELRVVADQRGTPTAASDIARIVLDIARQIERRDDPPWGTVHVAGQPATTWHGFAEAIWAEAQRHGPVRVRHIEPIPTSAYPTDATRPADTRLDCARLARDWGLEAPAWEPAMRAVVSSLVTHPPSP